MNNQRKLAEAELLWSLTLLHSFKTLWKRDRTVEENEKSSGYSDPLRSWKRPGGKKHISRCSSLNEHFSKYYLFVFFLSLFLGRLFLVRRTPFTFTSSTTYLKNKHLQMRPSVKCSTQGYPRTAFVSHAGLFDSCLASSVFNAQDNSALERTPGGRSELIPRHFLYWSSSRHEWHEGKDNVQIFTTILEQFVDVCGASQALSRFWPENCGKMDLRFSTSLFWRVSRPDEVFISGSILKFVSSVMYIGSCENEYSFQVCL